jgi:hypothetical protein
MNNRYFCQNENRRRLAGKPGALLNGIDFLEVQDDQSKLDVHFLHALPGPGAVDPVPADPSKELKGSNFIIEGGVRLTGIKVKPTVIRAGNMLTIEVDAPGDFSTYTLRLVVSPTDLRTPDGFDPQLAAVDFSFKVDCPSEFDCASDQVCPPDQLDEPEIDYLAKDFDSFRRLMLDRLSVLTPDWQERNPADLQVALVEMLAYVGDHLSYYQDAVATEAYLGTARKRISVRRHARLLDYFMHDGCNARTWVVFEVKQGSSADGKTLQAGQNPLFPTGNVSQEELVLLASGSPPPGPIIDPTTLARVLSENPIAFETMLDLTLHAAHSQIDFYTWSDDQCCLPQGSTRATLLNAGPLQLQKNDFLLFEELISPTTGLPADADPTHRQVVRLIAVEPTTDRLDNTAIVNIEWAAADALTFPLCLSAVKVNAQGQQEVLPVVSVARGNVTLADQGITVINTKPTDPSRLVPAVVPALGTYRPHLDAGPLTYRGPFDDRADSKSDLKPAASALMRWEVQAARPVIELQGMDETWVPARQADLLSSDKFATEFVVELESDGIAYLRFGDDFHGRKPRPPATFSAVLYRLGNGAAGNIGADVLSRIVIDPTGAGITHVRNPLAGRGGVDPEATEAVRTFAPAAFRRQERAVTAADYAKVTQRHPEVQKAAATLRWTGSWYTMFITIDRVGGRPVNATFEDEIRTFIERYRMAGYDVEINGPIFVPLDLALKVCVESGYFRSNVKQALLAAFSNRDLPSGKRGFFHPDNFTFGQPVYLSQLYEVAMSIAGVQSVDITRFQGWGKAANQELDNGVLTPNRLEVIQLDNDPNFAENGKLEFVMQGGL